MIKLDQTTGRWMAAALVMAFCSPVVAQGNDIYRINEGKFDAHVKYERTALAPGKEMVLGDITGPGKITYFYLTDDSHFHSNKDTGTTYPGLVLKIYWDDANEPSVRVPLWNFFGAFGRKTIDYQSTFMQINNNCYMSFLPMPFSKRARFVLANDGDQVYARLVAWGIDYEKNEAFAKETSRLHAAFSRSNPTKNAMHTLLSVSGKGHYVGNFLQVNSNYEGWWGEGDTIFEVDGEDITHTPGTEDEYGSTWGFAKVYSYPSTGLIQMDGGQNRMYRWYQSNPIRFQKSLNVRIQNQRFHLDAQRQAEGARNDDFQHGQTPSRDDYTSVVFWYQHGSQSAPLLPSYADRIAESKGVSYAKNK